MNERGEQRENGIEQLGVGFVLSCCAGGGFIELFDGGIFLTVALDNADTVEDILQQVRGSGTEDPGLDIAAADDLPELGDQVNDQRDRNCDEQRDDRVHEQNDDQRNDEGCNVDKQGGDLVNDKGLYDRGIGIDTLHQVTGRLSLQRGKRQGGDLFVQQCAHDQNESVTGNGGHTRLENTERTGEEVDQDDRADNEQESAHFAFFERACLQHVIVDGVLLDHRVDDGEDNREDGDQKRDTHHQTQTLGHAKELFVNFHLVKTVRTDGRMRNEGSGALGTEAFGGGVGNGSFIARFCQDLTCLADNGVTGQVSAGDELTQKCGITVDDCVKAAAAVHNLGLEAGHLFDIPGGDDLAFKHLIDLLRRESHPAGNKPILDDIEGDAVHQLLIGGNSGIKCLFVDLWHVIHEFHLFDIPFSNGSFLYGFRYRRITDRFRFCAGTVHRALRHPGS